jgi:hypothetical protein
MFRLTIGYSNLPYMSGVANMLRHRNMLLYIGENHHGKTFDKVHEPGEWTQRAFGYRRDVLAP